jgi:hypothetical protein
MFKKIILLVMLLSSNIIFASDSMQPINFIFKPINESNETKIKEYLNVNETNSWMYEYVKISDDKYLYTSNGPAIGAGIFYVDIDKKNEIRIEGGYGHKIKFISLKNNNNLQILYDAFLGRKGSGYEMFSLIDINLKDGTSIKRVLLEYEYDMESGLCGRKSLGFKSAGEINSYIIENKNDNTFIKFDVTEQNCSTKAIIKRAIDIKIN